LNVRSEQTNSNNITSVDLIKSKTPPTAIVAPLVPRKVMHRHNSDDISSVDTKSSLPPFKSATLGRQRPTLNWRNKDEKSEKSVKDKIAMFSNSTSDVSHIMPKTPFKEKRHAIAKSTENIFSSSIDCASTPKTKAAHRSSGASKMKKAMSAETLDDYEADEARVIEMNYTPVSKPVSLQSPALSAKPLTLSIGSRALSVENLNETMPSRHHYQQQQQQQQTPTTAPALSRRISFSGYTNSHDDSSSKSSRQKSISNILESRKKSMSKLRGLVIPERVPEQSEQKVLGLPVIRSKECDLIGTNHIFNRTISMPQITKPAPKSVAERKSGFESHAQVKPAPRRSLTDDIRKNNIPPSSKPPTIPPMKPPRTSLIVSTSKSTATDESDSETPPISPVAKKPLTRTFSSETNTSISSNSTLTSGSGNSNGSQASCSSNGQATEALASSRKSILASSKSRSGRDCLEKSWRDEDSTDGGIDNNDRSKRTPKAKTRNSLTNYKLIGPGDNVVDKVINVATYVEVVSSDSEDKPDLPEIAAAPTVVATEKKNGSVKVEPSAMTDMAKWVRSEAATRTIEVRTTAKVLEQPKKLNLSEIRKNFENKSQQSSPAVTPAPRTPKTTPPAVSHNRFSSWDSVASSSSGVSSELLGTGTGTNNSESLQTFQSDFGSFSSFGSSHSLITPQVRSSLSIMDL